MSAAHLHDIRNHVLSLCWVNNCYDKSPREASLTVGELIDRFAKPDVTRGKLCLAEYLALDKNDPAQKARRDKEKNGEGFIPARFKQSGTKFSDDVATINAFVLDLDGGVTQREFQQKLAGYAYLAHTSYSHSEDEERWRVIVFYDRPCTPAQHTSVFEHFNGMFDGRIDQSSKKPSQLWYTPACPLDAVRLFQCFFNNAPLFNPHDIGTAIDQHRPRVTNDPCQRLDFAMGGMLSTSPDPDRVCFDGERTAHLTRLAGMWLARGYQLDDVTRLSLAWNSRNDPPLDDDKVIATCAGIHKTHLRNHGDPACFDHAEITPLFSIDAYRADRFIGKEPPPRRWLYVKVLRFGKVGIIVAPGGTGKSQALMQVGVSIATGSPLFGVWEVGETGGVLMLLAEDDDEEVHRRLNNIIGQLALSGDIAAISALRKNLILRSMVGENNLMTETNQSREVQQTIYVDRLIATATQIPDLKLIIIDPASRFRGGNENEAQDTTRFVEAIERVAQATGATILIAHHTNKGSMQATEANQNASRGSSALTDGVRWQMNLAGMSEKEAKEFGINPVERHYYLSATITKNNYAPPQQGIMLKRGEGGYLHQIAMTLQKTQQAQDVKAKIVQLVASEASAGRQYSKTGFAAKFAGAGGVLGAGDNRVRTLLDELLAAKQLSIVARKLALPQRVKRAVVAGSRPDTPIS